MSMARELDILQRRMLKIVLRIRANPHESVEAFSRRAAREVSCVQAYLGAWSCVWACRTITWAGHIVRDTAHSSWPARIIHIRSSRELRERRAKNFGAPLTRSSAGWTATRWTEGVQKAVDHLKRNVSANDRAFRLNLSSVFKFGKVPRDFSCFVANEGDLQRIFDAL